MFYFGIIITTAVIGISSVGLSLLIFKKDQEKWYLHYFLGLPVIATSMAITSLLFTNPVNILLTFMVCLLGIVTALKIYKSRQKKVCIPERIPVVQILFIIALLPLLLSTMHSLLPPTGWDENVYHIPAMKEISYGEMRFPLLQDSNFHSFYPPFSLAYGNIPYASETIAAFGFGITQNEATITFFHSIHLVVFLFALYFLSKRFISTSLWQFAVFILLLTTTQFTYTLFSTSYVDVLVAACQILSVITLLSVLKKAPSRYITYSLVLFGFSVTLKYPALFFLPAYLLLFVYVVRKKCLKQETMRAIRNGVVFNIVFNSFWYLKNFVLYKTPFYPFLLPPGIHETNPEVFDQLQKTQVEARFPKTLEGLIETLKVYYSNDPILYFALAILILLTLYFLLKKKSNPLIVGLLAVAVVYYISNFLLGNQVARYVVFVPFVLLFLITVVFTKLRFVLLLLFIFTILRFNYAPLKTLYLRRIDNFINISLGRFDNYYFDNIGCKNEMLKNYQQLVGTNSILNLWDSYASVYYADKNYFYYITDPLSYDKEDMLNQIKFVYVLENRKNEYVRNADFHKTIRPHLRVELEEELLSDSKLIYERVNCKLYQLTNSDE